MKNIFRFMMMFALSAALLSGCDRREMLDGPDGPNGGNGGNGGNGDETVGYVQFAGSGLTVELDGERINSSEQTRVGGDDDTDDLTANFWIEFIGSDGQPVEYQVDSNAKQTQYRYSVVKNAENPIELPLGDYTLRAYSGDTYEVADDVSWYDDNNNNNKQPTYAGESEFTLTKEHTKDAPYDPVTVTCKLQTVKVTVVLEQALASFLKAEKTTVDVILSAENSYEATANANTSAPTATYSNVEPHQYGLAEFNVTSGKIEESNGFKSERKSAISYLKPVPVTEDDGANSMFVVVNSEDTEGNPVKVSLNIGGESGVKAGQWRKIWLWLDKDNETGSIVINATIENWVYDEVVTVPAASAVVRERTILDYDTSKLSITSSGDLNPNGENTIPLNGNGDYTMSIRLNTDDSISKCEVGISSKNREFADFVSGLVGSEAINLVLENTNSSYLVNEWGFPDVRNKARSTEINFNLGKFIDVAKARSATGEHTITFDIESGDYYYKSTMVLNITDGGSSTPGGEPSGNGPKIEWPGHDFGTRYETEGLEVKIEIKAPAGIEHLYVIMSGEIEEGLGEDMPAEFDLAHTADANFEGLDEALKELKFPVDEEVRGQKELLFDISGFMPLLSSFKGETNFTLEVVDANGASSGQKTIKLRVI